MLREMIALFTRPALALLVLAALWLTACSAPEELTEQEVSVLKARVLARWETLEQRRYEDTWEFSSPAYREVFSRDLYPLGFSYVLERELTGVDVVHYDAQAAVASVAVRVMSKPIKRTSAASSAIGATPATYREQWIRIDGKWWYSAIR